ncbi:MAG TPA: type I phosphomannose isomerase catalytic subunit [Candidatus Sulfotelmatobacter sp.]|jgi:mannose-6-phosphate isomerase|nr:type I phosphomannose isomerase catalytic subunit [Candidatus Sulfotelmatobacter sp.]
MLPVLSRLEPFFSPRIWGQRSLAPWYPDKVNLKEPLGEAWLTAFESRVSNGPFAGKTLREMWHQMPAEWRGRRYASLAEFPVLIKFIFPNDKLSIQVHPGDAYAAEHEQNAGGRGKTEMWHMVSARHGAEIMFGLQPGLNKEVFLKALAEGSVESLLVHLPVQAGDTYFVPAGTQHAIGPGMVICEIQEYSDLTYRVYDYGRLDSSGKPRELHVQKALEVTNFNRGSGGKIEPLALHSPDAKKCLLSACEFFATERWDCNRTTPIESDPEEFQLFVILEGTGTFHDTEWAFQFRPGEAWFLPANLPTTLLQPDGVSSVLRVTVPDTRVLRQQLRNQGFEDRAISRVLIGAE